jgi:alanine dehydrogenase
MIRLGIIRETKNPPDRRAPLTPAQCAQLLERHDGLEILVQPSALRCFSDHEYREQDITLAEDLSACDVLMGVKEVSLDALLPDKTYFFFSHTAKKQPYNRPLLQEAVRRRIRLVDYEYLTDGADRVVAFGRWAGVVGAYNALRGLGLRLGSFGLKPAHDCFDLQEVLAELAKARLGRLRFLVTGGGRVASGALEILEAAGIREVSPESYLTDAFENSVFTRLDPWHYTRRSDGSDFDFGHFIEHPEAYENNLHPYAENTDVFIACHFWDPRSPQMLTAQDLASGRFPIQLVSDISCDIGEPIASTIRPSTIADPFYGYDPATGGETEPFAENAITVMAVDNLPGELPRDAATDFGNALVEHVIPEVLGEKDSGMLPRATITEGGGLAPPYAYLQDFLEGR